MFRDRAEAGRRLAELVANRLGEFSGPNGGADVLVLGLPRGGVPVAAEVATALAVPLDVLVVRKLGVPWQPELALGAVGEGGSVVINDLVLSASGLAPDQLDALIRKASHEVEQLVAELRPGLDAPDVTGRTVVVVDDGVATGATARAAADILRRRGAGPVLLATATAPPGTVASLRLSFDEVICVETPRRFGSVGGQYRNFGQVSVDEVRRLLNESPGQQAP